MRTDAALSVALTVIAAILLAFGGAALYAREEFVDPRSFADRAASTLDDEAVRNVAAREIAANMIERGAPDLESARPLLVTAVSVALETDRFRRVLRLAARDANNVLIGREQGGFVVDVADATALVRQALESVSPTLAREVPENLSPRLLQMGRDETAATVIRVSQRTEVLGLLLPLLGIAALIAGVSVAPRRRDAIVRSAVAVGAACVAVIVALRIGRAELTGAVTGNDLISDSEAREAAGGVWDAFLGDLGAAALVAGAVAFAIAGAGAARVAAEPLSARVRKIVTMLAPRPHSRSVAAIRALLGIALGVALIAGVDPVIQALALVAGGVLLFLAADALVEAIAPRAQARDAAQVRRERARGLLIASLSAAAVVGIGAAAVVLITRDPQESRFSRAVSAGGCNGLFSLCDRRINEVAFPGTHNSMSAADSPGWALANQSRTIRRQLLDGIRLFLLDTHYGVRSSDGAVRTDLEAEGSDRNRIRNVLDPTQLSVATRLAGPVGLGATGSGRREPYLCHSVCELGATPLLSVLRSYREFLDSRPGEVIVLMFEPSITPADTERAFRDADLLDYVATLDRGRPLPTLGQLVRTGKRLVVFTERDGGTPAWYHDAFSFIQDTPLGARRAEDFSCELNRGKHSSPILMLNHWLDRFPPPPSANAALNGADAIVERARACERRRGITASFIAVDFYDRGSRGGVVAAARRLNQSRRTVGDNSVWAQERRTADSLEP